MPPDVTTFLDGLNHPLRKEIDRLRQNILRANAGLSETIKWNAPNFCFKGDDRITMRIYPPTQVQLIFHRGAKVIALPEEKLINDTSGLLTWKSNDRAVATFKNMEDIIATKAALTAIINKWLKATAK